MATKSKVLIDRLLTALYAHQPHLKAAVAVTGGGTAAAELLFRAGSSSTMLQYTVPYHRVSLQNYVGKVPPSKFCSAEMAERMAMAAWEEAQGVLWQDSVEDAAHSHEARSLTNTLSRFRSAIGVGCTAALATTYDRRGLDQSFISVCRVQEIGSQKVRKRHCETYHLLLDKSLERSRQEQDQLVSRHLVYLLVKHANVDPEGCEALYEALREERGSSDQFEAIAHAATTSSDDVLSSLCGESAVKELTSVLYMPPINGMNDAAIVHNMPVRGLVLSGSFNPLHQGHVDLAVAAQKIMKSRTGVELPILFEIAVSNADKGSLSSSAVMERVRQFSNRGESSGAELFGNWPVIITNASLFGQKAALLHNCVFIIGADTAVRIVDKKYYDMDEHKMVLAINEISRQGCKFVVAGRFDENGSRRYISAEEVLEKHVPPVFKDLFIPLREEDFRNDISSTQLRQKAAPIQS
ncbi:hypothetical protein Poli38472_011758 [Pythium oligandrum]|uniref:Cytidyltransferase-like domain-containing protein n=1 Tax=Pythium oligandrum TaxID=41045 RepID=A0A8K1FCC3_PYTOL|nr:hypothetical protein Poli38472_011758 [Pythium oligandrum]|eukprot:TMW58170.1 hypothetical protein Poli38472_011758 [Pythium oligandrum]